MWATRPSRSSTSASQWRGAEVCVGTGRIYRVLAGRVASAGFPPWSLHLGSRYTPGLDAPRSSLARHSTTENRARHSTTEGQRRGTRPPNTGEPGGEAPAAAGRMRAMARRTTKQPLPDDFEEHILDIDVGDEMRASFLEYAYSVIYSRALPDARDGLKPVQRRILYTMNDMGLRPDRGHVKSARVVGEVMGRLHPHGDGAIYDALVRMAQPWSMRLPMIDGHGNFGSPDDVPAAMRYTECRMAPPAVAMTASIDEDTVDFKPNYDSRELEPSVLPAAIPNLVVNGATGIAVGMATNMAPHNLVEVVQALRHLITHPEADVDDLMRFIPGPTCPPAARSSASTASATPTSPVAARSGCGPPPGSRRSAGARASSSPSCPTASAPRRSSSGSRTSCRPRSSRASPTSRTSPTARTACAWSSRSRTASSPRRCSSSSTGRPRWRTPSASTPSRSSTASPARSASRRCSRSSWATASTSYAAARRSAAARRPTGCTSSTAC